MILDARLTRRWTRIGLLWTGLLWIGTLLAVPGFAGAFDTVLIVSIDALHPDALSRADAPALQGLMQSGTYTLRGRSVDPPKTLIAHTAMFTGLAPEVSGKRDNDWRPGEPQVQQSTLFDDAKALDFHTAFFYAKPKLGFLVNAAVDVHGLAPDDGIDQARAFFRQDGRRFCVLHISGLEYAGSAEGWLSEAYLDTLSSIDLALAPLLQEVAGRGKPLVVVTSDHGGHDRLHGTQHPDDYKLPLILTGVADADPLPQDSELPITELRRLIQGQLTKPAPTDSESVRQALAAYLAAEPMENLRVQPDALQDDPREDFYFVLDVRKPDEFAAGHITGAVNVPYQALTSHLDGLPEGRDEPILIYCDSAQRSTQALMALRLLGYSNVWYLNGGLHRWQREGRPIELDNL